MCLADQAPTTACVFKPRGEYLRVHAIGIQQSTTGDPWIHILAVNQEVGWWLSREVKIEIKLLKDLPIGLILTMSMFKTQICFPAFLYSIVKFALPFQRFLIFCQKTFLS
jgi:hypothetical protein